MEAYPRDEIRSNVQAGDVDRKMMFSIRKELKAIVDKATKGAEWEVKQFNTDLGLYYNGHDLTAAYQTGQKIIGDLFGYFQDGAAKKITRTVKDQDDGDYLSYKVIPFSKPGEPKKISQIKFSLNRNIRTGGPVISIVLDGK